MQSDIAKFIKQFHSSERAALTRLINRFHYVTNQELHRFYRNKVLEILEKSGHKKVAIFTLQKPFFDNKGPIKRDGLEKREIYDSSSQIGRILYDIEKEFGGHKIVVNPTAKTLRAEKIKTYIYIDDLIGSGKRLVDCWVKYPAERIRSAKSLKSYKRIKIYMVVYVATQKGLKHFLRSTKTISKDDIHYGRIISDDYWDLGYDTYKVIEKNASGSIGFGDSFVPYIFEHGCHNCLPLFLYKKINNKNPLFPGRAIPPNLKKEMEKKSSIEEKIFNCLADINKTYLAYGLAFKSKNLFDYERVFLLPILSLKKSGYSHTRIKNLLYLDEDTFEESLQELRKQNLIDAYNLITESGKKLLSLSEKNFKKEIDSIENKVDNEFYLPLQFRGLKKSN